MCRTFFFMPFSEKITARKPYLCSAGRAFITCTHARRIRRSAVLPNTYIYIRQTGQKACTGFKQFQQSDYQ